jgi:hypothetical protein
MAPIAHTPNCKALGKHESNNIKTTIKDAKCSHRSLLLLQILTYEGRHYQTEVLLFHHIFSNRSINFGSFKHRQDKKSLQYMYFYQLFGLALADTRSLITLLIRWLRFTVSHELRR